MKRKSIALLSTLLAGSMVLSACGKPQPGDNNATKPGQPNKEKKISEIIKAEDPAKLPATAKERKDTLIVGITAPSGKFNPIYSDSVYDGYVTDLIFNGLVTNDKEGLPVPLVAKEWKLSEDNKTYTFTLKEGVKFSNGDELTAEDVAFTYTALCDPKYDGPRADAVEKLVGYKEYKEGNATEVTGIKVIDKYNISFTLTEVKAPAIYDFIYGIMNKKVYGFEKGGIQKIKDLFLKPMGSGAYKLTEYKPGQTVSLTKNDGYFKGTPKIPNIIMKVTNAQTNIQELQAGTVDIDRIPANTKNISMLKQAGFLDLQLFPDNGYGYLGLNTRLPKFKDKKVRQALMYGLDRKSFVDSYYNGYADVCNIPISPVSWAYNEDVEKYPYNLEKAKQLLDEAGWKVGADGKREKDGEKFVIHWKTYTGSKYVDNLIPIVKDNWGKLGIEVIPELVEFATLSEKVYDKQDFEMYNMAWSLSIDPDPSGIFGKSQDILGGFNSVGWHPDKSEELIKKRSSGNRC
ncbi:ABC transporter substrate-binding protein [Clostridium polynesiense]|uniref:ABC transporter substrate-binding protein n=1 Tax=Clostridium polynesiense TaxID=1325933 RepID=UPI000AAB4540|nr:ABC transporter substrate-binding protein [Clostridium polynesiense]